jgi:MFS family permease
LLAHLTRRVSLPDFEGTFSSLQRHYNYRLFFAGQLTSVTGAWMQETALPWLMLSLNGSALDIGLLAFCRYAPITILSAFAGAAADRFDNRRLLAVTQAAAMVQATVLTVLAATGSAQPWELFALATMSGVVLAFDNPTRFSFLVRVVGPKDAPNAIGLNSSLTNGGRIIGPALAGVIIAASGVTACFAINSISYLAVLLALLLMRPREFEAVEPKRPLPVFSAVREGLSYVRRGRTDVKVVLGLVLAMSISGFNFRVLLPLLASKTLHASASIYGLLFSAYGLGAIVGALSSASAGRTNWRRIVYATAGFSAAMLILSPLRSTVAALLVLFVVGLCYSLWTSQSQSMLLLSAPQALRGRMASVYLFALVGLSPVGSILCGWLADVGGTELAFGTVGLVGLIASGLAGFRLRGHRAFEIEATETVPPATELLS